MQLHSQTWETTLLNLAHEARTHQSVQHSLDVDSQTLTRAYAHCDACVTRAHSQSFHLASALLPAAKRRAARALYAFCRVTDDTVDCERADRAERLSHWRTTSLAWRPPSDNLVAIAWADTRQRFAIPLRYAEQLIDGVGRDLYPHRCATFEDLAAYSYGVASTVGLMTMHIIGYESPEAYRYAIKLGVALQVTNILRDIGEDLGNGRLYLPQNELEEFDLTDADLSAGVVTPAWREFMRFQIERNRRLYAEAWPGIALLNREGRFAIGAAASLYGAILDDIEANDYDVFTRRARVSRSEKVRRLPSIWWRSRHTAPPAYSQN